MNDRIRRLAEYVKDHDIYPECREIELDPFDDKLAEPMRNAKRLADYMLAQEVVLRDDEELIGLIKFDKCPVPSDIFPRCGHAMFREVTARGQGEPAGLQEPARPRVGLSATFVDLHPALQDNVIDRTTQKV